MKKQVFLILALLSLMVSSAWAQDPDWLQAGDTWDASTKTLTVNNNPWENLYSDNAEIQHLVFADNVTNIGKAAFDGCENLESVTFAENSQLETINGWAFGYCGKLTTITIPASVITLNGPVFTGSGLQTIFFEEGSRLQTIGNNAFDNSALTAITIPASVITINLTAFSRCANLSTVNFEENSQLETIDHGAFMECFALKKITLPANVTFIGDNVFDNCQNLSEVTILAQTPPTLGKNVFEDITVDFSIFVPKNSVDAYKTAYPDLADRIKPIMGGTGIESIQNSKFKNQNEDGAVYSLSGQRLSKPQKGINIINGNKVLY